MLTPSSAATRLGSRIQSGVVHPVAGEQFGDVVLSRQVTIAPTNTAANPVRWIIYGQFETRALTGYNTSAMATAVGIQIGTDATASALTNTAVSAIGRYTFAPSTTALGANWQTLGSPNVLTTCRASWTSASAAEGTLTLSHDFIIRG